MDSADPTAGLAAASIVRAALKGALGSLDRSTGGPYASLVTIATEPDGTPILLISRLALHTRNLEADPRASLMLESAPGRAHAAPSASPNSVASADPLASGRVTLSGRCRPTDSPTAARRFLSRHPSAAIYAGFADFRFFAFEIDRVHLVGGFGRIVDLTSAAVLTPAPDALRLAGAEADILAALNDDQSDVPATLAAVLGQSAAGVPSTIARNGGAQVATRRWRVCGIDPFGCDATDGATGERIWFTSPPPVTMADVRSTDAATEAREAILSWASARAVPTASL